MKVIRSWLSYNDITTTRKIKIRNASSTPTIEDEQVPSQEELARIYRNSSSRVRLAEALLALTDLRYGTKKESRLKEEKSTFMERWLENLDKYNFS